MRFITRIMSSLSTIGLLVTAVSASSMTGGEPNVNDETHGDSIGQANEG